MVPTVRRVCCLMKENGTHGESDVFWGCLWGEDCSGGGIGKVDGLYI